MRTADDDPALVTRRSYELIAGDYEARNAVPTPEYAAWRDEWVTAVRARAVRDGAAAARASAGVGSDVGVRTGAGAGTNAATGTDVALPVVLDAGAGPGHHAAAFRDAGLRAVALDLSIEMTRRARGRGVAVVRGDLRRLPFARRAFDGVWASASFLHVPAEQAPATLREWRRVTRTGGLLALTTASGGAGGWEDPPYDTGDERPPPRWFVYHDEEPLRRMLDAAGWDVESVETRQSLRTWLQVRAVARG